MKWEDHPNVLTFSHGAQKGKVNCAHRAVAVDKHSRSVWCRKCDAVLDPIDVISRYATDHYRMRDEMDAQRTEHWEDLQELIRLGGSVTLNKKGATVRLKGVARSVTYTMAGTVASQVRELLRKIDPKLRLVKADECGP